jgi:hypothetical protein
MTQLKSHLRECWNWQTGTFEGRVLYDVRVQVSSRAPRKKRMNADISVFMRFLRLTKQFVYHELTR